MWKKAMGLGLALVAIGFGAVVVSLIRWQLIRG